jgi:uncharacterized protein YbjT (DUF2867 family)
MDDYVTNLSTSEFGMILITGASGRIARRTAELLAEKGVPLRLMSRTPEYAPKFDGVQLVAGDFKQTETLDPAFSGVETAFVVSAKAKPGERALLHKNAFAAAVRAGVRHVVYLSLKGTSRDSRYPFCRDHDTSEQFLRETGVPHTVLRIAFYQDMFVDKFDAQGIIRGPAGGGQGAFIAREDTARAAAAAVVKTPGGVLDITGPELLSVAEVARRLSVISGRALRYEEESAAEMRGRLDQTAMPDWARNLEVGWFQAIAAGEQSPETGTYRTLTGENPKSVEAYFTAFPERLGPLSPKIREGQA